MTAQDSADEEERDMLERILTTSNARELRRFVRDHLDVRPDESVLSIGCGPGFETAALAENIGEQGHVHGVDVNGEALAVAKDRCADLPQVSFQQGDATDLPLPDEQFDVAIAKQVYQFVSDIDAALRELYRVLGSGGRAAIVENDVDARVIHSSDRDRMHRVNEAYRAARQHPHLGTRLVSELPAAGFIVEDVEPRPALHTAIDEQVERGIEVSRGCLEADDSFDQSEIDEWEQDLRDLDEAGEFLSCGTQFLYIAKKP